MADLELKDIVLIGRRFVGRPGDLARFIELADQVQREEAQLVELAERQRLLRVSIEDARRDLKALLDEQPVGGAEPVVPKDKPETRPPAPVSAERTGMRLSDLLATAPPPTGAREGAPADPARSLRGAVQRKALAAIPVTGHASLAEIAEKLYGRSDETAKDNARHVLKKLEDRGLIAHPDNDTTYTRTAAGRAIRVHPEVMQ